MTSVLDEQMRATLIGTTTAALDVQALAIADIHDYLRVDRPNTRLFAIACLVATAKLHALGRGLRVLLVATEDEAASVLLRPAFETAAACSFLHRAKPQERELLSRRFLLLPLTKGVTKYLRTMKRHGNKQLQEQLEQMEVLEAELKSGRGGLNSWHGSDVKGLMSGAGLDAVNSAYIELLHADMHGPVASQYLKMETAGFGVEVRGLGSRTLPTVGLAYGLWCSGVMNSELLSVQTRFKIGQIFKMLTEVQTGIANCLSQDL